MATLTITKSYADGSVLTQAQLDAFCDSVEVFFNTTKINDDNIQTDGITGSTKILSGSVTAGKIAANAVTAEKIEAGAVTASKIDALAATNAKFGTGSVTAAKITDGIITPSLVTDPVAANDNIGPTAETNSDIATEITATLAPTLTGSRPAIVGFGGKADSGYEVQGVHSDFSIGAGITESVWRAEFINSMPGAFGGENAKISYMMTGAQGAVANGTYNLKIPGLGPFIYGPASGLSAGSVSYSMGITCRSAAKGTGTGTIGRIITVEGEAVLIEL
jgi:hypothetical protein